MVCVDIQLYIVVNSLRESSLYDNIFACLSMTSWEIDIVIKGINKSEKSAWEYNKDQYREIISCIHRNRSKMVD